MRRKTPGLGLGTTASSETLRRSCARHSVSTSRFGFAATTGSSGRWGTPMSYSPSFRCRDRILGTLGDT